MTPPLCARTPCGQRSSRLITNMNSTRPKVDSADSPASDFGENSAALTSGATAPSTIGPSSTPAAISPTTPGWPSRLAIQPQMRAATSTTMSCSSREVADMA